MDLIELIEGKRFLGREFLTWLWFESELFEGHVEATGVGSVPVWLESRITLDADEDGKEQSKLKGGAPAASPEAREAMRQGKLPTMVFARAEVTGQPYAFVLTASTLALSSVSIPALLKDEGDEPFYERMRLIEDLEALIAAFYAEFIALRVSTAWEATVVPAMKAWIHDETPVSLDVYRKAKRRTVKVGAKPKAAGKPDDASEGARA